MATTTTTPNPNGTSGTGTTPTPTPSPSSPNPSGTTPNPSASSPTPTPTPTPTPSPSPAPSSSSTTTASPPKANLIDKLLELLKKIIQCFQKLGIGIGGGGVTKQLEKLSEDIKKQAENGQIQNEVIDDLVTFASEINGKLETLTPETVEEVMQYVESKTQEVTDKYKNKTIDREKVEPNFLDALKKRTDKTEMTDEEFKKYFDENATLLTKNGKIKDGITFVIGEKKYDVNFVFKKDKDGKNEKKFIDIKENTDDISLYKKAEINPSLSNYSLPSQIIISLANAHGFCTETQARVKIAKELNEIFSSSVEKNIANFLSQRTGKVVTSENGRFESSYEKNSNSLIVRDRATLEALVIKPTKSGKIHIKHASDIQNINDISTLMKGSPIGSFGYDNNSDKSKLSLKLYSQNIANILHSKECIEFLSFNGVRKEDIDDCLKARENKGAYPVTEYGMNNIQKFQKEIENVIKSSSDKYKDFKIEIVQAQSKKGKKRSSKSRNSAVYLQITDCNQDVMSFAFKPDGIPSNICFKSKDDKQFQQIYNFGTKSLNEVNKLQENPEFACAFKLCTESVNSFAKKLSEPSLAQGLLIAEPIMPKVTTIRDVPNELLAFSERNRIMSVIPNQVAVYSPFTKDNVFNTDITTSVKKDCFFAMMLDSLDMKDMANEIWKKSMETSIKEDKDINTNAIDTKSPTAIVAYKASVYEAMSDPNMAKQFVSYISSDEFKTRIHNSRESKGILTKLFKDFPFSKDKTINEALDENIKMIKKQVESELENLEPLEKGEGMTLELVAPTNFNDDENHAGFYLKGDISKRVLNLKDIETLIYNLVDRVGIPQQKGENEYEIKQSKASVIVDELVKVMREEGFNVDEKRGNIVVDNTDTNFQAPKTMTLVASINNVIKASFNGIGKDYLDKILYNEKPKEKPVDKSAQPQPVTPPHSHSAPVNSAPSNPMPTNPTPNNPVPPTPTNANPSPTQTSEESIEEQLSQPIRKFNFKGNKHKASASKQPTSEPENIPQPNAPINPVETPPEESYDGYDIPPMPTFNDNIEAPPEEVFPNMPDDGYDPMLEQNMNDDWSSYDIPPIPPTPWDIEAPPEEVGEPYYPTIEEEEYASQFNNEEFYNEEYGFDYPPEDEYCR